MGHANLAEPSIAPSFADEALPWLPHVARYARLLTHNAADADDLTQETFLRAYRHWHTYQAGTGCRQWLFTICRHAFVRSRGRMTRVIATDDIDAVDAGEGIHVTAAQNLADFFNRIDIGPAIESGLAPLSVDHREAVMLVDVEGYSYEEAASLIGVPVGTVRSRLFRGRRRLQQALIEYARDMGWTIACGTPDSEERP